MKTKTSGILSILSLISTILFLIFFILDMSSAGPLNTFEQVLAHTARQSVLSFWAYANVTLLTILVTMFLASLYILCKQTAPLWSAIAIVFAPVYCVLNLFAYFSQITIVPRLLELGADPQYRAFTEYLLYQLLQSWPGSAVSIFNNTAYAILGIPSIIFGVILYKMSLRLRLGGIFLALNGVACILGIIGIVMQNAVLSWGSMVGAVFFLVSLFPLSWHFLRGLKPGNSVN